MIWIRDDEAKLDSNSVDQWMLGTIITVEHKPNLLCLWVTRDYAGEMDNVPQQIFRNQALGLVRRSMWNTNSHFKGTYSYRSVDSDNLDAKNEDLAESLMRNGKPIIQFAGKATDEQRYFTVHGAIESGFREANRLIQFYSN